MAVVLVVGCGSNTIIATPGVGGAGVGGASSSSSSSVGGGGGSGASYDACHGEVVAQTAFGSDGLDHISAMALDAAGNIYLAGTTEGIVQMSTLSVAGYGGADVFVAKLAPDLRIMWAATYGDDDYQAAHALALDAQGNLVIAGESAGTIDFGGGPLSSAGAETDVFVVSLSPDGEQLWSTMFHGFEDDFGYALDIDDSGFIALAGDFRNVLSIGSTMLLSAGESDIFVARLDASGSPLWARSFGDADDQGALDIATFSNGDVAFTGSTGGLVDFGGGPIGPAPGGIPLDAYLVKLDSNGNHLWSTSFGGASMQRGRTLAVDDSDAVIAAGQFDDTVDFLGTPLRSAGADDVYLLKASSDGIAQWVKRYGDPNIDNLREVTTTPSGDVLLAMPASGSIDFGCGPVGGIDGSPYAAVIQLTPDGELRFNHIFGDPPNPAGYWHQYAERILQNAAGQLVVLGNFHGGVQLGDQQREAVGDLDVFLAVLATPL